MRPGGAAKPAQCSGVWGVWGGMPHGWAGAGGRARGGGVGGWSHVANQRRVAPAGVGATGAELVQHLKRSIPAGHLSKHQLQSTLREHGDARRAHPPVTG